MSNCEGKSCGPSWWGERRDAAATIDERIHLCIRDRAIGRTPTTRDFRCDRVWVWVDSCGNVHSTSQNYISMHSHQFLS
ncbi:inhibitor of trypsin and hageman factor [Artemisia annua]|uniref:Inhibitor of trypsin and hageman factor n=1 Tax=Artemisia annua TaxID=35608 RepID=A0A2U1KAJ8_ARTAN|nr:inhibitor of trypsin and hageman factor [Artemisia annua]